MTYAEALARLLALRGGEHAGMRPGLARIEALLEALGNPEQRYTLVQVGGTNGKGSTAAMLAAVLRAAGRRVGLYTSPHLVSFRERIRVDGEAIAEDDVADGFDALATLVARLDATMFEATTALALDHFAREAVDVAVLEVGLGGRLDATTVGEPAVAAIARIDLDHQEVLGSTLEAIAREKAAIIRSGIAVAAAQAPEAAAVLRARAAETGVPLQMEGRELAVRVTARDLAGQTLELAGPGWRLDAARIPLLGTFQPSNALLAAAAARALDVDAAAIREGLARARWPGRFEVLRAGDRHVVLDGAHNPGGAHALAASLAAWFDDTPVTLVFAAFRDKDAAAMLAPLAARAHRVILTASGGSLRDRNPEELADVSVEAVLAHPTWRMGAKITVDSATLMNKGLEVIEARWLFEMGPERIEVVVHPQSIVHSMVELVDGSVIAQLGVTDMRLPIQYAFSYPERWNAPLPPLDLTRCGRLDFEAPDTDRFPCLALAFRALEGPVGLPIVLNAANEVAVARFLGNRLPFTGIAEVIEQAMERYGRECGASAIRGLDDVRAVDGWAREFAGIAAGRVKSII